jgi:hypothetical protein
MNPTAASSAAKAESIALRVGVASLTIVTNQEADFFRPPDHAIDPHEFGHSPTPAAVNLHRIPIAACYASREVTE